MVSVWLASPRRASQAQRGSTECRTECPTALGSSLPESTGGSAIIEYEVEWNEKDGFDGTDGGSITTTSTSNTISGLTEERGYYVRVLARNFAGSGEFCENEGSVCTGSQLYAVATADA